MKLINVFLAFCVVRQWPVQAQIDNTREEISNVNPLVEDLETFFACKRLFTREGQLPGIVGCGSDADNDGDFGRLFEIRSREDFNTFLGFGDDRAILIPPLLLENEELAKDLAENDKVKVILVAHDADNGFNGEKVVEQLFKQPVALLGETETEIIRERLEDNVERGFDETIWNNGVLMDFYNGKQDVTTEFCLELRECDLLGGQSVWGTVGRSPSDVNTIMLAVKLDTNGLFHDLTFGARDTAGPLSVLLSVAEVFSDFLEEIGSLDTQLILAAFQGESFDAMGSKRFAFDVENSCQIDSENFDALSNSCEDEQFLVFTEFNKLDLSKLDAIIVLDNLIRFDSVNPVFVHTNQQTGSLTSLLLSVLEESTAIEKSISLLPGTIIQSFSQFAAFDGEAIVLTSFQDEPSEANPFKFSPGDRVLASNEIDGELIKTLAVGIAAAVVQEAAGNNLDLSALVSNFSASLDADFAAEIAGCLTFDFTCQLVQETLGFDSNFIENTFLEQLGTNQLSGSKNLIYFVGILDRFEVSENKLVGGAEEFTRQFLTTRLTLVTEAENPDLETDLSCGSTGNCFDKVSGEPDALVLGDCQPERKSSVACVNRTCVCSTVFFHDAVSPLIDSNGNIREEIPNSIDLSAEKVFTEPRFALPTITTFQHTFRFYEIFLIVMGLIVSISSYLLINCTLKRVSETKYKLL